jgi:hypothetical protein
VDRDALGHADRAGIEPFLHPHHHHGGFAVTRHDRALDGCSTTPAGQGGAVQVEAAKRHGFQHRHGEDQPISHYNRGIGFKGGKLGLRFSIAERFRRQNRNAEAFRRLMHRRFHQFQPAPPTRSGGAGIDSHDLMALTDDFGQRRHGEGWRAHEGEAQAHASSSRFASLVNFLITRSRFSFEI